MTGKAAQSATPRGDADAWGQRTVESARWYDRSVNWEARFGRELPLIGEALGSPGSGGIVDAGCGSGRHSVALAARGYTVTGIDASQAMLDLARSHAANSGVTVRFDCCSYEELGRHLDSGHDGVICIGNSQAAAGTAEGVAAAVKNFAALLRPGGRLFVQVLNFPPMRDEVPCLRGPRVTMVDGVEYVSVRSFHFHHHPATGPQGRAEVTNVTLWHDHTWHKRADGGTLYPMTPDELVQWCRAAGLEPIGLFGAYDRTPFDPTGSGDLILIAERKT